jgi:hypothetical protein
MNSWYPQNTKRASAGEGEACAAGALNDVEARRDQRVATEREDDRGGVQRPQAPEGRPFQAKVESGESKLKRDIETGKKTGQPPEHRGDHAPSDRIVIIFASHPPARITNVSMLLPQINGRGWPRPPTDQIDPRGVMGRTNAFL